MFNKFQNLKIVKKLSDKVSPKLRWLMFSQMQDYKINSKYIDMLCSDKTKEINSDAKRLESMVRESLIKEFSPDIVKKKSHDLLVTAVTHNLMKKQLEATDSQSESEMM